jgi:hypothetical protein
MWDQAQCSIGKKNYLPRPLLLDTVQNPMRYLAAHKFLFSHGIVDA